MATESRNARIQPGETVFGRFRLARKLGEGGMGEVWQAHDPVMEQNVALKFVTGAQLHDATALMLLKREAQKARVLTHPNIVRVFDFHEEPGLAGISMEYVEGETLQALQGRQPGGVFEPGLIADLVAQICEALHFAHGTAGMIHRDLKPANLMVDGRRHLRVMDFGIAAPQPAVGRAFTRSLAASGTLPYMSPQQLQGMPPTPKDDLYSLGATLYELFTGAPPFYQDDIPHDILYAAPPPVRVRREQFGIDLPPIAPVWETVIAQCLSKDPARRPPHAKDIATRLMVYRSMPAGAAGGAAMPRPAVPPPRPAAVPAEVREVEPAESLLEDPVHRRVSPGVAVAAAVLLAVVAWVFGRAYRHDEPGPPPAAAASVPEVQAPPAREPETPPAKTEAAPSVARAPDPVPPPLPVHLEFSTPAQHIHAGGGGEMALVDLPGGRVCLMAPGTPVEMRVVSLGSAPALETFSAEQRRIYFGYPDGRITSVSTEPGGPVQEEEFARHPVPPLAILAIEHGLLVADKTGAWGTATTYGKTGGRGVSRREYYPAPRYSVWNTRTHRAYFISYVQSPRDIHYDEIGSNLTLGKKGDSPYHDSFGMEGPIVVLGRFLALGSGHLYDPVSLEHVATLPFEIRAGANAGGLMFVADRPREPIGRPAQVAVAGETRIHRIGSRGEVEASLEVPGRFIGMTEWAGSLAVATDLRSKTRVFFLNGDLGFIDPPAPGADEGPVKPTIVIHRSAPANPAPPPSPAPSGN